MVDKQTFTKKTILYRMKKEDHDIIGEEFEIWGKKYKVVSSRIVGFQEYFYCEGLDEV